jgi:hypothetical protein
VLSLGAGGEVFSGALYGLGVKAFKGKFSPASLTCSSSKITFLPGYVAKTEELDLRMFDSRILLRQHEEGSTTAATVFNHHVLCVTLKDDSVWVVDPAGAQHGQSKAVLPFSEYDRDFVAKVLDRRPYGTEARSSDKYFHERHSQYVFPMVIFGPGLYGAILEYVVDELAEWEFKHVTVGAIVRSIDGEYQRLKSMLIDHLTTAACDSVKYHNRRQKSPGQPILIRNTTREDIPEAEKQKIERKRIRKIAALSPFDREYLEKSHAEGPCIMLI